MQAIPKYLAHVVNALGNEACFPQSRTAECHVHRRGGQSAGTLQIVGLHRLNASVKYSIKLRGSFLSSRVFGLDYHLFLCIN